jgi:hypothetical protein
VSPESLGAVGRVSHEALRDLAALLQRVDRFATKQADEPAPTPSDMEAAPEPTPESLEPGLEAPEPDVAPSEVLPSAPPEDGEPRF